MTSNCDNETMKAKDTSSEPMMNQNTGMAPDMGMSRPVGSRMEDVRPVIPLPNPGEGGPVYPGDMDMNIDINNGSDQEIVRPMIPLPNPGEGGPVYPGDMENTVDDLLSNLIGTIITTYPRPNVPCQNCQAGNGRYGIVRFLNAASNYNPFRVYINGTPFAEQLNHGEMTEYEKTQSGMRTVTVAGEDGYIYIQKAVSIPHNQAVTIAIINTESGLDLFEIPDEACKKPFQTGCIRVCNLALNSGPLNIVIGQRYVNFANVSYKEITQFRNIWPGEYNFYVSRSMIMPRQSVSGNILLSSSLKIDMNSSNTMYLFQWNLSSPDAIQALIV